MAQEPKGKQATKKKDDTKAKRTICNATQQMIEKASSDGVSTVFDRTETMKPCPIGAEGSCCKNCGMGPCRVPAPKKKDARKEVVRRGI